MSPSKNELPHFMLLPGGARFILHSELPSLLKLAEAGIHDRSVVTLYGERDTGKSMFLKGFQQWVAWEPKTLAADQVVIISLKRSPRAEARRGDIISPMTLVTFALLWRELQRLQYPAYLAADARKNEDVLKNHGEGEFWRMSAEIERLIRELGIAAICIDNAELLDDLAVDWLIDLRECCEEQFGLVLSIRLEKDERSDFSRFKPFAELRDDLEALTPTLRLRPITLEQFPVVVLPKILATLEAKPGPDLEENKDKSRNFIVHWWKSTHGRWRALALVALAYDKELADQRQRPRLITQKVVDRVTARLAARNTIEPVE
jgi:hypothetical protein